MSGHTIPATVADLVEAESAQGADLGW